MAQVILFRPREEYSSALGADRCPLGLLYVAAGLQQGGYSVRIIDSGTCADWRAALAEAIGPETLCAGVGVMTGFQISGALEFAAAVKAIRPLPVIWGGLHPSIMPEQTAAHPLVDVVVVGEGERRMRAIVDRLADDRPLDDVPGICFERERRVHSTATDGFIDLDELPLPPYELIDVEHYASQPRRFAPGRTRCLELNTDRGCPSRCGFCYNLQFNRRRWRPMSAEKVLDALERLVRTYRLDAVNFVADNFFVNQKRVRAICEGILARGIDIRWHSDIRVDTFLQYDDDLLDLVRRSGCTTLTFGIESGSTRTLALIDKDVTAEQNAQAVRRARDLGFELNCHFMIGYPEETRDGVLETLRMIHSFAQIGGVYILGPSTFVPYPGTTLYDRSVAMGYQPPERLEDWSRFEWYDVSPLPWFSASWRNYLWEAGELARKAYCTAYGDGLSDRLRKAYFRLRFKAFLLGVRTRGWDVRLGRLLKRLARNLPRPRTAVAAGAPEGA